MAAVNKLHFKSKFCQLEIVKYKTPGRDPAEPRLRTLIFNRKSEDRENCCTLPACPVGLRLKLWCNGRASPGSGDLGSGLHAETDRTGSTCRDFFPDHARSRRPRYQSRPAALASTFVSLGSSVKKPNVFKNQTSLKTKRL